MGWILEYGGASKSFEEWGLCLPKRITANQLLDEVTFDADGALADSEPLFAYDSIIVIKKDGVKWFEGRIVETPAMGVGPNEALGYRVAGVWTDLDDLVMQVPWNGTYTSHLLYNIKSVNGVTVAASVREVILQVLEYAISKGVAIAVGDIFPDADETIYPMAHEETDRSCGQVIRDQLSYVPQVAAWIDYSASVPKLHARLKRKLVKCTVGPLPTNESGRTWLKAIQGFGIRRRDDLIRPSVWLKYEIKNTEDGVDVIGHHTDFYPPGSTGGERRAFVQTFSVLGRVVTTVKTDIVTEPISKDDINWWKERFPHLKRPEVNIASLTSATRDGQLALPRFLVSGQIAPWMDVQWESELITGVINFALEEDDTRHAWVQDEPFPLRVIATDAETGTYSAVATVEEADPIPVGLAQFLYESWAVPQWEGQVVLTAEELMVEEGTVNPPQTPRMGVVLNIAGLKAAWETMDALVQRVEEDAETGTMTISFGPPTHLGPGDLIDLLRVGRRRRRYTNPLTQETGELAGSGSSVEFGEVSGSENGYTGQGKYKLLRVIDGLLSILLDAVAGVFSLAFGGNKTLTLDKNDANWTKPLKVQKVCVKDGTVKKEMQIIGSDPYVP